jgi:nitrite reductase (NO-forming)
MEIIEKEGEMADGVKYVYWTFGGTVPEVLIRTSNMVMKLNFI